MRYGLRFLVGLVLVLPVWGFFLNCLGPILCRTSSDMSFRHAVASLMVLPVHFCVFLLGRFLGGGDFRGGRLGPVLLSLNSCMMLWGLDGGLWEAGMLASTLSLYVMGFRK